MRNIPLIFALALLFLAVCVFAFGTGVRAVIGGYLLVLVSGVMVAARKRPLQHPG